MLLQINFLKMFISLHPNLRRILYTNIHYNSYFFVYFLYQNASQSMDLFIGLTQFIPEILRTVCCWLFLEALNTNNHSAPPRTLDWRQLHSNRASVKWAGQITSNSLVSSSFFVCRGWCITIDVFLKNINVACPYYYLMCWILFMILTNCTIYYWLLIYHLYPIVYIITFWYLVSIWIFEMRKWSIRAYVRACVS